MINFELFKEFAKGRYKEREMDIFFNYLKKYLQASLKNEEELAGDMLGKANSILCRLNSMCYRIMGNHFLTQLINPFCRDQIEEVIGEILIGIIISEDMLKEKKIISNARTA